MNPMDMLYGILGWGRETAPFAGIIMNHSNANRFQDFFKENKYTLLKNYLYNYRLRKMAVEKSLQLFIKL